MRKKIMLMICEAAQTHHVIVDTWFLKPEHIAHIAQSFKIHHLLAYCPFLEIVIRTIKRNNDALIGGKDIWSMRFFHQALKSFIGLYDLSDNPKDSLDVLDKNAAIRGLDIVSLCLKDSPDATGATMPFTRGEFSLEEFVKYRQELLRSFVGDTVYVIPKSRPDSTIRTDQKGTSECAESIMRLAAAGL